MVEQGLMAYKLTVFGASDLGLVRTKNEDAWIQCEDIGFFALADGMGGHRGGKVAAEETILQLCRLVRESLSMETVLDYGVDDLVTFLLGAIQQVNGTIHWMSCAEDALKGMGTTLCCCSVLGEQLVHVHVGDSRIYCLRNESLQQLTRDHSLMRDLIETGELSLEQAPTFKKRNVITRAIGIGPIVEPSVGVQDLQEDDLILMCSDGLTDYVMTQDIEACMNENSDLPRMVQELISLAKEGGGGDNITAVVIKVEKTDGASVFR